MQLLLDWLYLNIFTMIHYTLLPEREIRILKREYQARLFIFVLFFMSCAILVGVVSLIPAYVTSYSQEKYALAQLAALQKSREEKGNSAIVKELQQSNQLVLKLKEHKDSIIFSSIITHIINYKVLGLTINSFEITSVGPEASSTAQVVLQGKASTRESLIKFKNTLEADPLISKVELPVSDLAKSKDISYSLRISVISFISK